MAENETFGERLRRLRKKQGLNQVQLAEKCLISVPTMNRWEQDTRQPRAEEIKRLAGALNVTENELLNGVPEQNAWVLQIKIATEFKEEVIDMRGTSVPTISNVSCTPKGAALTMCADYDLWQDTKKWKAFIKKLEQGRNLILQNGKALGGIKDE